MLSRVAQRLYWMARYLERSEDTARLVNAYSHLILDIPEGVEPGWGLLLDTFDSSDSYDARYKLRSESNIIKFLLADPKNPSSIRYSLKSARENVRTTRDVLPAQVWELVNECYLYCENAASRSIGRQNRFLFMEEIVARNQQISGAVHSTVSRDHSLWFMQLGRLVERADMTSRIVDVGSAAILERSEQAGPRIPLLWASLLASLSAKSAYQRRIGPILSANSVVNFIFKDPIFPRSELYCINEIEEIIGNMKAPSPLMRRIRGIVRMFEDFEAEKITLDELRLFVDEFQLKLADLHDAIEAHWFEGHEH